MLGRVMMKITRLLATLLFLPLVLSLCLSASAKIPLIVQTTEGPVIGSLSLNGQRSFKGIPYASPPIGPLRWHSPQDPPYHELPLLCDSFRSSGPSYPSARDNNFSIETFTE
ncbi:MAG: carboxylesterase family protein, partial [Firmicutes bacterium]|nr:carboxylesterase family protein [Bacillota bacterium]